MSKNKKINTRSSTEDELIGEDDALPQILWTKYFIEAQGYGIDKNIMYQDNISNMLLETNVNKSSTKKTKHIQVLYFFIKYQVTAGDVELKHCLPKNMLADHFTKPLQGELFRRFISEFMNIPEDADINEMGWDGTEARKGVLWKLHNDLDPACPQEFVGNYVERKSMPDASSSEVLHTYSPAKEIAGTGTPILDWMALGKPGKKNSFSDIVKSL